MPKSREATLPRTWTLHERKPHHGIEAFDGPELCRSEEDFMRTEPVVELDPILDLLERCAGRLDFETDQQIVALLRTHDRLP